MKLYQIEDLSKHIKHYHPEEELQQIVDKLNTTEFERDSNYSAYNDFSRKPYWYQSNKEALEIVERIKNNRLKKLHKSKLSISEMIEVLVIARVGITSIQYDCIDQQPLLAFYNYDKNEYQIIQHNPVMFKLYADSLDLHSKYNIFLGTLMMDINHFAKYEPLQNYEVPVKNGIFNTLTGQLEEDQFGPEITVLNRIQTNYVFDAYLNQSRNIDVLRRSIDRMTNGNEDRKALLYQIIKCSIANKSYLTRSFIFLYGSGINGKYTLMKLLSSILGSECLVDKSRVSDYQKVGSLTAHRLFDRITYSYNDQINDNGKNHKFLTSLGGRRAIEIKIKGRKDVSTQQRGLMFLHLNKLPNVFNNSQVRKYATTLRFVNTIHEDIEHEEKLDVSNMIKDKEVHEYLLSYILNEDLVPFFDRFSGIDNIPNVQFDFFTNFIDELLRSDVFDNEILPIGYLYQVYKRFAEDHSSDNWQVDTSILSLQKFKAKMEPLLQECGYEDIGQQSISKLRKDGLFDDKKNYFSFNDQMMRALFTNSQQIKYTQQKSVCFKLVDNDKLKQRYNQMIAYQNISAYDYTKSDIYHY